MRSYSSRYKNLEGKLHYVSHWLRFIVVVAVVVVVVVVD